MSIFEDPSFKKMKESMSKEEQEKYDKAGQHMYSYDYDNKGENKQAEEVLEQLRIAIRSGLHPSDLTFEEREFLEKYHPLEKKWFKEFGFLENELNRII